MIVTFTIYDIETGKIKRTGMCPDFLLEAQARPEEALIPYAAKNGETHVQGGVPFKMVEQPPPLEEVRAAKLAELALERYRQEVGGITVNGILIATDRESRSTMAGTLVEFQAGMINRAEWKTKNGWVDISASQLRDICAQVATHVQFCFAKERRLSDAVNEATTVEEINAIVW